VVGKKYLGEALSSLLLISDKPSRNFEIIGIIEGGSVCGWGIALALIASDRASTTKS
jgi:hypothetical protein